MMWKNNALEARECIWCICVVNLQFSL